MKIKNKSTLGVTAIVAAILVVFSVIIFLASSNYRANAFSSRLKENARRTIAFVLIDDEVETLFQNVIEKHAQELLPAEHVRIHNGEGILVYETVKGGKNEFQPKIFEELEEKKKWNLERKAMSIPNIPVLPFMEVKKGLL